MSFKDSNFYEMVQKSVTDETSEYYVKPDEFEIVSGEVNGHKYSVKIAHGVIIGNLIINVSNLKITTLRSDDVLLTGYPKSGIIRGNLLMTCF